MLARSPYQRGFSLVELMIGSAVGLFVIAGAVQLYVLGVRAATDTTRMARLNQELRATIDLLRDDLRRAGYWSYAPGGAAPTDNPFQSPGNRVRLGQAPGERDASCILYSYDLNADGRVGVGAAGTSGPMTSHANLEQFGFRLRNGQVQMRNGGAVFDCGSGSWQTVTDPDTEVTALHFTSTAECSNLRDATQTCSTGDPALLRQQIRIELRGRSRGDQDVVHQLTSTVAIANDLLLASHP